MKQRNVIPLSALPPRSPIPAGILLWLLLDRLDAPGWAFGVVGTLMVLWLLSWVRDLVQTTQKPLPGYGEDE